RGHPCGIAPGGGAQLTQSPLRGRRVEPHLVGQRAVRVEPPQRHAGIGHGGPLAAAPVARRARDRPGAIRPDAQGSTPVHASDAACAAAAAGARVPPLEVITRSAPIPRLRTPPSRRSRYVETLGRRYASTVVVLVRSNSRNSGSTSCPVATGTRGSASRRAPA